MIGQYPHGIDLHVRNLRWALNKEDKIFIVTLPEFISQFNLKDNDQVKYIPFAHSGGSFIPFWESFPTILGKLNINPEWFLFMEEDIWFHKKNLPIPKSTEIMNYLPLQMDYHAIMRDGKVIHARVWEGGTLVNKSIVRRAINSGISFSFVNNFFYEKEDKWKNIALKYFKISDTFDEFGLYCALVESTKMLYKDYCVHLRGPESLHRKFPELYDSCTENDIAIAQKTLPYLCVRAGIAPYYIDGHWKGSIDWKKIDKKYCAEFKKLSKCEWMTEKERERLNIILEHCTLVL